MDYNETDYEYNDYDQQESGGAVKGLKIAIIILLVILTALSIAFFRQVNNLKKDKTELKVEQDTLASRLAALMGEMGDLQSDNDTLNAALLKQRFVADSIFERLKQERNISYNKLRQYEKEVGTLRTAMQGFVRQIDSLSRANQVLADENIRYRRQVSNMQLRVEAAEETAAELGNVVKRGAQIRARDITLLAVNKKEKAVSKAKQAEQLISQFVIAANDIAQPGEKTVYVVIYSPDDAVLASADGGTFSVDGNTMPYSARRNVDYQGDDLSVSVFYPVSGLFAGQYTVMVYMDGALLGQSDIILK